MTRRARDAHRAGTGRRLLGAGLTAAAAAGITAAVSRAHRAGRLPQGQLWDRTNHRGDPVTLVEGVAAAAGAVAPLVVASPPGALAALETAIAGGLDDLTGATDVKGLRGHLAALSRGELTTGAVKILALVEAGILSVSWSDARAGRFGIHTVAGAGLVAGGANLVNLFDLRPGRALKVVLLTGLPTALRGDRAAAAACGAAAVSLPDDLAGRSMLGDVGANPLGALVGLAAAQELGPRGRWLALLAVTGLTLASERVSFTRVIADTPVLDALDRWGRPA